MNKTTSEKNSENGTGERLLVVDDTPYMLEIISMALQQEGMQADVAHDGEEALAVLQQQSFTAVLCDLRMPGMGGVEMAQRFREWEKEHRETRQPIFGMSVFCGDVKAAGCRALWMDAVFMKPVDVTQVRDLLRGNQGITELPSNLTPLCKSLTPASEIESSHKDAILLVDDMFYMLQLMSASMAAEGIPVIMVTDGADALAMLKKHTFTAALIDLRMPGMDGIQMTRTFREFERANRMIWQPVYGMSGFCDRETAQQCRGAYMDGVMMKPFNIQKIVDLVRKHQQAQLSHLEGEAQFRKKKMPHKN